MEYLMDAQTYRMVMLVGFAYVAIIFVGAFVMKAPYGRFASDAWGLSLSPRLGWFLMELPATLSFVWFYFAGDNRFEVVPLFFLGIWLLHYGNRGFVFPFLIRAAKGAKGSFSLMVVVFGWLVTSLHGYLNAVFIGHLGAHFTPDWFLDPRFLIGMAIYLAGFTLNLHSDAILRNLRSKEEVAQGKKIYRIPQGGLYRYVTNPSYLTELISFTGFAIATWSLGAVFVLLVSAVNLIPRAFQAQRWYLETFPDYPKDRKVLVPFII